MASEIKIPLPLSIYRGQSSVGIGEPEGDVSRGEQFLTASPELRDADFLKKSRFWMTLDADPSHHQALGRRLESWSYFKHLGYVVVVRLTSADRYTGRDAYFSHAYAWRLEDLAHGFDPGALIGSKEAFSPPWRDQTVPPDPPDVRPEHLITHGEPVSDPTAARMLARLLEARVAGKALLVTAPLQSFKTGESLHRVISFARAALPWDLKIDCPIRILARLPDLFFGKLNAGAVVVPEGLEDAFLRSRPDAFWVNQDGKVLSRQFDDSARKACETYAGEIWSRHEKFPKALLAFSERFGGRRPQAGAPITVDEFRAVRATYNLTAALQGTEQDRAELLERSLVRTDLDWKQWVDRADWLRFPRYSVENVILESFPGDSAARGLQVVLEGIFVENSWVLDERLGDWNSTPDGQRDARIERMLQLALRERPLITPSVAAEFTRESTAAQLRSLGRLEQALEIESRSGGLENRRHEALEIVRSCPGVDALALAIEATTEGAWSTLWVEQVAETSGNDDLVRRLASVALKQLAATASRQEDTSAILEFLSLLLDRCREMGSAAAQLLGPLAAGIRHLATRQQEPDWIVRLTDVWAAIDPGDLQNAPRELVAAFQDALRQPGLSSELKSLVIRSDHLSLDLLEVSDLLWLGASAQNDDLQLLVGELDRRIRVDREGISNELLEHGWWTAWRAHTSLRGPELRQASKAWLASGIWFAGPTGGSPAEPLREDWKQVIEDLRPLGVQDLQELFYSESRHIQDAGWPFPRLRGFETEQVEEIAAACSDLSACLCLYRRLEKTAMARELFPDSYLADWIYEASTSSQMPSQSTFRTLVAGDRAVVTLPLPRDLGPFLDDPYLQPAFTLLCSLGLSSTLRDDDAAKVAGDFKTVSKRFPAVWQVPALLSNLASWLISSVDDVPESLLKLAESRLPDDGFLASLERPTSPEAATAIQTRGFPRVAALIRPRDTGSYLPREVVTVLRSAAARPDAAKTYLRAACWQNLLSSEGQLDGGQIAQEVERQLESEDAETAEFRQNGWALLRDALLQYWDLVRVFGPDSLVRISAAFTPPGALGHASLRVVELLEEIARQKAKLEQSAPELEDDQPRQHIPFGEVTRVARGMRHGLRPGDRLMSAIGVVLEHFTEPEKLKVFLNLIDDRSGERTRL